MLHKVLIQLKAILSLCIKIHIPTQFTRCSLVGYKVLFIFYYSILGKFKNCVQWMSSAVEEV